MQRLLITAPRQAEFEAISMPTCAPTELLVRARVTAISTGTEIRVVRLIPVDEGGQFLHANVPFEVPTENGYSMVGEVIGVGADVADFVVGDRVFVPATHRHVAAIAATLAIKLPPTLPDEQAVFLSIAEVAHLALRRGNPTPGETVAIIGLGVIGLSALAYNFLGGVLHHAPALTALFNPTVNSYKRINAPVTSSGATWAPNTITYTGNNRTHMVRIPEPGRFELRLADGAANPDLLQAGLIAAGLDGIATRRDPGKRLDINMYTDGHGVKDARKLPLNLLDSLRAFEANAALRAALGEDFAGSYLKLRLADWNAYSRHLTQWELDNTLDC